MDQNSFSHKDLLVWQKSMNLVTNVYQLTQNFPSEERYGLSAQMRRSAIAIPCNIAEGHSRNHLKEYIQFLYIAKSSAAELKTQILIAESLKFNSIPLKEFESSINEILKMLSKLISNLKRK